MQVLEHLRGSGMADRRFDVNLAEGKLSERCVAALLASEKYEVKRDFKAKETGNVAVEYECRGQRSGIATTEAEYWVYVLGDLTVCIKTEALRKLARKHFHKRSVVGGDEGSNTKMVLVPLAELLG